MDSANLVSGLGGLAAEFSRSIVAYLPRLVVASALLVAGWIVGRLLRWLTRRFIARLGRIRSGRAIEQAVETSGAERVATEIVSRIVFWTVFVFSAALAGEVLGLAVASGGFSVVMRYLPSVLAAVVIVVAGLVLSNLARDAARTIAISAGVGERIPGQLARYTILLLAAVVALDQIGIDSTLLILAVGILMAAIVGSAALAVGLGARTEVSNIIALHYLSRSYTVGQRVRIGDQQGRIVELRTNGVVLDTPDGRLLVPAKEFSERVSCLLGEAA